MVKIELLLETWVIITSTTGINNLLFYWRSIISSQQEIIVVKYSLFQVLKGHFTNFFNFLFIMRTKEMRVSAVTFIQIEGCYIPGGTYFITELCTVMRFER